MASAAREKMILGAVRLLASRGLQATSFSEVLAATGAPRGSVYHHFPQGKDQLVASAVGLAGAYLLGALETVAGRPALEVAERFMQIWRSVLVQSNCEAGCAVLAVTVASGAGDAIEHAREVFRSWRARLAELLEQGGMPAAEAGRYAVTLIAAAEGAVVLSRADRSLEPFDAVAEQLLSDLRRTG